MFTDDGSFEARMVGPDGSAVEDVRRAWFSPPPWAVSPFPEPAAQGGSGSLPLLRSRFQVVGAIRHANKGGVYQAVDKLDGRRVVIKQARAHVGTQLDGTDVRDRLREEARMLQIAERLSLFPAYVDLFDEQGDLFLAEEELPGTTLDRWARDNAGNGGSGGGDPLLKETLRVAGQLVAAVSSVHRAGLVLRDLKPGNVMVTPDGHIRLIDAETLTEQDREVVPSFTVGFAPPEILAGSAVRRRAARPADCFSLGVTLFCLATEGLDAHWVSGQPGTFRETADRRLLLSRIAQDHPVLALLSEPIIGLTETDPERRWTVQKAAAHLAKPRSARRISVPPPGLLASSDGLDRLLADGLRDLTRAMVPQASTLWPADSKPAVRSDPCDAWRGAAGPLATLTRAAEALGDPSLSAAVVETAAWIDKRLFDVPRILPGLFFGRAGTAWALFEAATFLGDERLSARALDLADELPVEGPYWDVARGLSGAGLALLRLWQATGETGLLDDALDCADSVSADVMRAVEEASRSTSAPIPDGSGGFYGFAHGVAGAGAFMLAAAQAVATSQPHSSHARAERLIAAASSAGDALLDAARIVDDAALWPTTAAGSELLRPEANQWCNGSAGIGTFLIRLWAATGEQRLADIAVQCVPPAKAWWASTTDACCGLVGSGHLLLDLAEFTGEERFAADAESIAHILQAQRHVSGGLHVTGHPDRGHSYGQGTAGTLDYLLRLSRRGSSPWLPDVAHDPERASPSAPPPAALGFHSHRSSERSDTRHRGGEDIGIRHRRVAGTGRA